MKSMTSDYVSMRTDESRLRRLRLKCGLRAEVILRRVGDIVSEGR